MYSSREIPPTADCISKVEAVTPPIFEQLDGLISSITYAENLLDHLEHRCHLIYPPINQSKDTKASSNAVSKPRSPLAEILFEQQFRVNTLNERISNLLSQIEI